MNALELVREICASVKENKPATLAAASDTNTQFVLSCLNRGLQKAAREFDWQALQRDVTFNANTAHDAYDPASGGLWLKKLLPDYGCAATVQMYQAASAEPVLFAQPDEFKRMQSGGGFGAGRYFSLYCNRLVFWPRLTGGAFKVTLRYQSAWPVFDPAGGKYKARFEKDADETELDEELVILAAIYKYKQELGLEYAEAMADYQERLFRLKNTDTVQPVIRPGASCNGRVRPHLANSCLRGEGEA